MTAIVPTEISVEDVNTNLEYGASKRRAMVFVRGTCAAGGSGTIALATYLPNIADIEGVIYSTDDNAISASSLTWSTTTLTIVAEGVAEIGLMCVFT